MSQFEFIFSLYSLLLGLSLVELLGGLGRTLKIRLQAPSEERPLLHIGWLTPLLGLFVMLDLLSFWGAAWAVRDLVTISGASLMSIMLFASAYYLAAYLVFPDNLSKIDDLDEHYFRVRRIVFAVLFILLVVQLGYYAFTPELAVKLNNPRALILTGVLALLMITGCMVKHKATNAAVLIALIFRYGLVYAA